MTPRLTVYQTILDTPVVPVFFHSDLDTCRSILQTAYRAGIRAFEFTNRGDFAHELFGELVKLARREMPGLVMGAGTILDAPTAALYVQLGANFIVAPTFSEEVARFCNRRRIAYMPGCATLTEISRAEEWGVEFVKLFPGDGLGPGFVKALHGPMPQTRVMVTGGVEPTIESLTKWFNAGVSAVGIGSQLFAKELIQAGAYTQLEEQIRQTVDFAKTLRRS
ncbi:bifunctional 4-hydroxy-2-oxoglutarate aldolase/2-dehydro-3-deoxy-phosphogluconate aldolase [Fibrella sp. WM1]|uniref:bifunctional 4-hydroxy-2-oxoglutarate aldolase/2-dehydro-3-deoxy-phosphogluconate aldolase n=1 Tax=Fibrella musci TaxID=3242485 RepID=UPI00351F9723